MEFLVSKFKIGDTYLNNEDRVIQITSANMYLVSMSNTYKAITVEYLDTKEEVILSWNQLYNSIVKHLGNNPKVARVLYEKVTRSSHENLNISLDPATNKYDTSEND